MIGALCPRGRCVVKRVLKYARSSVSTCHDLSPDIGQRLLRTAWEIERWSGLGREYTGRCSMGLMFPLLGCGEDFLPASPLPVSLSQARGDRHISIDIAYSRQESRIDGNVSEQRSCKCCKVTCKQSNPSHRPPRQARYFAGDRYYGN